MTQAEHPVQRPGGHDLGEQLGPLGLLGWHWPTIFGLAGRRSGTLRRCPRSSKSSCTGSWPSRRWAARSTQVWMVDSRYGRGGTTPAAAPGRPGRPLLHRGAAPGQAPAARHGRADPRRALRHDRRPGGRRHGGARPAALRARASSGSKWVRARITFDGRGRAGSSTTPAASAPSSWRPTRAGSVPTRSACRWPSSRPPWRCRRAAARAARTSEGAPDGPGAPGRHRQPAGRRDPVAGRVWIPGAARRSTTRSCARLHKTLRATLRQLSRRGGSHMGELMEERYDGGRCPRDGDRAPARARSAGAPPTGARRTSTDGPARRRGGPRQVSAVPDPPGAHAGEGQGEHDEERGLDRLERPEPVGRLVGDDLVVLGCRVLKHWLNAVWAPG